MSGISLSFFRGDQHGGIFKEIESTTFAASAVLLPMAAGGALKRERGMAARAEFRGVRPLGAALRAFHGFILAERNREGVSRTSACGGVVNARSASGRPFSRAAQKFQRKTDGFATTVRGRITAPNPMFRRDPLRRGDRARRAIQTWNSARPPGPRAGQRGRGVPF